MKIHVIQPVVPHYRVPFFRQVAEDRGIELNIFAARELPGNPKTHTTIDGLNIELDFRISPILGGRLYVYDHRMVLDGEPDVIVLCGNVRYISNFCIMIMARRRGIGVVWFSHLDSSTSGKIGRFLRRRLMRLSDAILLYTRQERARLIEEGVRQEKVFFTGNALDVGDISLVSEFSRAHRSDFFPNLPDVCHDARFILYTGRLTEKSRVDILIEAMALLSKKEQYFLIVVGEGGQLANLELLSSQFGVSRRVCFLGEVVDQRVLAGLFSACDLYVYPGDVGLSIIHALYFGIPAVIHGSRQYHNPEADAFEPGVDGVTFTRGDSASLALAIERSFSGCEIAGRARTPRAQRARVENSIDGMAAAFMRACSSAFQVAKRKRKWF